MKTNTQDLVSATKAARDFSSIAARVADGSRVVVLKNNEPSVAIVPMADMEQLDRLEEREEDMQLLAVALTRIATDDGADSGAHRRAQGADHRAHGSASRRAARQGAQAGADRVRAGLAGNGVEVLFGLLAHGGLRDGGGNNSATRASGPVAPGKPSP